MEDIEVKINGGDTDGTKHSAHMANDKQRHTKQGLDVSFKVSD